MSLDLSKLHASTLCLYISPDLNLITGETGSKNGKNET